MNSEDPKENKKRRWWKEAVSYVDGKEIATWKGSLVLMFFFGFAVSSIWGARTDFYVSSLAAPNSSLYFSPSSLSVANRTNFSLIAKINPGVNRVTALTLRVTFDQSRLRLDSITPSSTFSLVLKAASINNSNGTVAIDLAVPLANSSVSSVSDVATLNFYSLAAASNSPVSFSSASQAAAEGESGNVISSRVGSQITIASGDGSSPTGGSVAYANGYNSIHSIALAVNDGADPSGISTASRIVQRRSAGLSSGACGAYGSWVSVAPSGTHPNFWDKAVITGNCYQYRYLVSDSVGNQAIYGSANTAKITYSSDISLNGTVDVFDYSLLYQNFEKTNCGNPADIVLDCVVNFLDYGKLHEEFTKSV